MKRYIRPLDKVEPVSPSANIKNNKTKQPEGRKSFQEELAQAIVKEKQKR